MRNGNPLSLSRLRQAPSGSYRTYEEWKLASDNSAFTTFFSSYRTYEEWKREEIAELVDGSTGSYRTYEEWKRW